MDRFQSPGRYLDDLGPEMAGRVIASATDVALIIEAGIIRDIAIGSDDLGRESDSQSWRDRLWIDTVTEESRPKVEHLLRGEDSDSVPWRQVNHPSASGTDVPIQYTAVRTTEDRVVALGRDLRAIARLQQRLVDAHQRLERDYDRLRDAESRYELLFRVVSEPLLIVEADSGRIREANLAAAQALERGVESVVGSLLEDWMASASKPVARRFLAEATSTGEAQSGPVESEQGSSWELSGSAFSDGSRVRIIVRLCPEAGVDDLSRHSSRQELLAVLEALPDGLVVVGADRRIVAANHAFAEMAQLVGQGRVAGGRLSDFIGRSPTETNVLISNLRNYGIVRNFATVLRDRFGSEIEVEVSAVTTPGPRNVHYGLSVRNVARRLAPGRATQQGPPWSADQLAGLVGRVSLKEIVRDTTDYIEKLCIEAALETTDDNRASAAEMLGLSRQSLYSKLKRFGLEEANGEGATTPREGDGR